MAYIIQYLTQVKNKRTHTTIPKNKKALNRHESIEYQNTGMIQV